MLGPPGAERSKPKTSRAGRRREGGLADGLATRRNARKRATITTPRHREMFRPVGPLGPPAFRAPSLGERSFKATAFPAPQKIGVMLRVRSYPSPARGGSSAKAPGVGLSRNTPPPGSPPSPFGGGIRKQKTAGKNPGRFEIQKSRAKDRFALAASINRRGKSARGARAAPALPPTASRSGALQGGAARSARRSPRNSRRCLR